MKKLLLLLALSLQADSEPNVETPYKHPEPREIGDSMPTPSGENVSYTVTYGLNRKAGKIKKVGTIFGYDINGDNIPEYEFIRRSCDSHNYAVYDSSHELLYLDSSRDKHIDSIVEDMNSIKKVWAMIPMCEQKKISV